MCSRTRSERSGTAWEAGYRCAAGAFPEQICSAASFHGGNLATDAPESPHLALSKSKARLYIAGAIEDQSFPDAMKERLREALNSYGLVYQLETYEGARHGWAVKDLPPYNKAAAERHWEALLSFYQAALL